MSSIGVIVRRAVASTPFLLIAAWCFRTMDIEKLISNQQPFVESGVIEWDGGKIPILDRFHNVDFLDRLFRGTTVTFSPGTIGYDSISSWQTFSFLVDLGPVYTIWILESYRVRSGYTSAYFPTFFSLAGQVLGMGLVAPLFYFLCFTFGPTASDFARSPVRDRTVVHDHSGLLLPIVVLFHTSEVFAMFLAPEPTTRHYWTWAWQLAPLWIGVSNVLFTRIARPVLSEHTVPISPRPLLPVLGLISAGVWVYTLLFSPYSITAIFLPVPEVQSKFVPHVRKAFQADELALFSSSFLWLAYSFFDLRASGLATNKWLYSIALLSALIPCIGPGASFIAGWYLKEKVLLTRRVNPA
ncbi:hypothetical protein AAE478_008949 [Parahypoxylon ruwenzoriense]